MRLIPVIFLTALKTSRELRFQAAMCEQVLKKNLETKHRQSGIQYRVRHLDGHWHWHISNIVPVYDEDGQVVGCEGISSDITERKKKEEEILYLNYHDILTGIYNRRFYERELKRLENVGCLPILSLWETLTD